MSGQLPEDVYKEIVRHTPVACVDIVIVHEGKVLLLLRKNEPFKDVWWFPGGRLQKNEYLSHCALRKVKDETGLDVEIVKKLNVYESMDTKSFYPDISTAHTINTVFIVKTTSNEINLDNTHDEYKWIDHVTDDMHPYIKEVLIDANVF